MATIPTKKTIKNIQRLNKRAERVKKIKQFLKGKKFVNNDSGVIPEKIWRGMK